VTIFEIRISKPGTNSETNKTQTGKFKTPDAEEACLEFWLIWSFEIVSNFGFRASNLPVSFGAFARDMRKRDKYVTHLISHHTQSGVVHSPGGLGWTGFGPKARAVSRCGRVVRESARWRANSLTAGFL